MKYSLVFRGLLFIHIHAICLIGSFFSTKSTLIDKRYVISSKFLTLHKPREFWKKWLVHCVDQDIYSVGATDRCLISGVEL